MIRNNRYISLSKLINKVEGGLAYYDVTEDIGISRRTLAAIESNSILDLFDALHSIEELLGDDIISLEYWRKIVYTTFPSVLLGMFEENQKRQLLGF